MTAVTLTAAAAALAGCVLLCVRCRAPRRILPGVAAGLLLYFAVQSAVERRLFPGLLLPFENGVFLPLRTAVLCICLLCCLAFALTERGGAILSAAAKSGMQAPLKTVILRLTVGK